MKIPEPKRGETTVNEALELWEEKGPTSWTVAKMADALYGVRDNSPALYRALVAIGWEEGHQDSCRLGHLCSAHQPLAAKAQQPRVDALVIGVRHFQDLSKNDQ